LKNKKSETIADLNINLLFTSALKDYEYFIEEFKAYNPKLPNYEIKSNEYLFNITINAKLLPFRIYVMKNGSMFNNTLHDLMFQIYKIISDYLFDNEIFSVLELKNFVKTIKSEQFTIDYEIILL
jgi:hypothetical protein